MAAADRRPLMGQASPELFADGTCGRPLPAGEVLQEFRIGQFCPVKALDGVDEAAVVVGESRLDEEDSAPEAGWRSLRAGRKKITLADLLQVVALTPAQSTGRSLYGAAGTTGQNLLGQGKELPERDPDTLIYLRHTVDEAELDTYLANPWAALFGGGKVMFPMSAEEAAALRRDHETLVGYGVYEITVKVRPSPVIVETSPDTTVNAPVVGTTGPTTPPPEKVYSPSRLLRAKDLNGIVLALYFEWKQTWTLKGFSRGRLLQSLALAPQEETTIELFTWDRTKKSLEQSSSMESEQSFEDEEKTQDTTEVFRELASKEEFQFKIGGSLDLQYNPGPVKINLKASGEGGRKTNSDDVCRNTIKAIRDGVHKSSARVKTQRSSKVTETTEIGTEQRITRKVRNPNLCHTLNLDYYEILTHYQIATSFNEDAMRFCAMIPNPSTEQSFSRPFIRQHESALRDALLDRTLASGFDAVRFLRARELATDAIAKRRKQRENEVPPAAPKDQGPQSPVSDEETAANGYLATLKLTARKLLDPGLPAMLDSVFACLAGPVPALGTRKGQVLPHDLDAGKRWLAQQLFLRSYSQLTLMIGEMSSETTDPPAIRNWGPRLASVMPDPTSMPRPTQLNLEPQQVKRGLLTPAMWGPGTGDPKWVKHAEDWDWWWAEVERIGLFQAEDAGLGAQVEQFTEVYEAFLKASKGKGTETEQLKLLEKQQRNQDRQSDDDRLENDFPLRDYAHAEERAEVLERHLQEHAAHYSFALFTALPPQEQLDHIERAMASVTTGFGPGFFQPRVVSQIGSLLLVPLNHEMIGWAPDLLASFKDNIDIATETDTVMLPSPGLTIEARLGRCSAAEDFIEETRRLDLALRAAEVRKAVAEAERLEKRVAASQLDDPKSQVPRVAIEMQQPPSNENPPL